jgi:hypothetical protein
MISEKKWVNEKREPLKFFFFFDKLAFEILFL